MDDMDNILTAIGLTKTEFTVYRLLLQNEKSPAHDLIKKSSLHRATVYDVLNRLIEKGLASYIIINDKKFYSGTKPQRLKEILSEHKKDIESNERKVQEVIKDLSRLKSYQNNSAHIATIYEGKEGLKTIMQDILNEKKDFYTLGGQGLRFKEILPAYTKHWAKERERLKIYARKIVTQHKDSNWKYNIEKRIPEKFNMPSAVIMYGSKVAIIINNDPLTIILIDDKNVSKSYMSHFNVLWKQL